MAECTESYSDCVIAGENWDFTITFLENVDQGGGTTVQQPANLTGSTVELQLLVNEDDAAAAKNVNITITDPENGIIEAEMTAAETLALNPEPTAEDKKFIGDVRVTYPDGSKEVIVRLDLEIEATRNRPG